jgi:hypothetical protein
MVFMLVGNKNDLEHQREVKLDIKLIQGQF